MQEVGNHDRPHRIHLNITLTASKSDCIIFGDQLNGNHNQVHLMQYQLAQSASWSGSKPAHFIGYLISATATYRKRLLQILSRSLLLHVADWLHKFPGLILGSNNSCWLVREKCLALIINRIEWKSRAKYHFAIRPQVCLLRGTFSIFCRIRKYKYDWPLVNTNVGSIVIRFKYDTIN